MVKFDEGWPRRRLRGHLLWFLIWCVVTLIAILLTPSPYRHGTHQQLGLPPCPSVLLFGRPCPGCGLTTSFTATVHGDLPAAFNAHALGSLAYLLFTASALACLYGYLRERRFNTDSNAFSLALATCITVFLIFGIVRMTTTRAHAELEPIAWKKLQR